MDVRQLMDQVGETVTVRQVVGEPIVGEGLTVIPVAKVQGGGGGGPAGGFGINARPAGVFVIRGNCVSWEPALDLSRIILGGQIVVVIALLTARSIVKARLAAQRSRAR